MRRSNLHLLWYFVAVVVVLLLIGSRHDTPQFEQEQYCRMVWAHKHDAKYGWPDFHHTFDEECNSDGTVRTQL